MCRALGSIPPGHDQQYDKGRGPPCLNFVHIANPRPSCHKSSRSIFVSSQLCDFPTSHWAQREPQAHGRYAGCRLQPCIRSSCQPRAATTITQFTPYLLSNLANLINFPSSPWLPPFLHIIFSCLGNASYQSLIILLLSELFWQPALDSRLAVTSVRPMGRAAESITPLFSLRSDLDQNHSIRKQLNMCNFNVASAVF